MLRWWNGLHTALKMLRSYELAGSNPALSTLNNMSLPVQVRPEAPFWRCDRDFRDDSNQDIRRTVSY